MRPDVIEGSTEVVEVALLGTEVGLRRPSGLALEGSVHSFVTAILLWLTRFDGLGTDAETDPPSAEACEASEADGSEGRTVVGADDSGQAELAESPDEYRLGELDRRGVQASALEQETAEAVLDGEGIAVAAIEHLELAFEVDGPDRIGLIHGREWLAGMARFTGSSALLRDQVVALEDAVDRPASWGAAELLSCEFADLA